MKKIIILISLFFISLNVYAVDIPACTDSELSRLKELANSVSFKKNYKILEDEEFKEIMTVYNIEVVNYNADLKIYYKTLEDEEVYEIGSDELLETDFMANEDVTFYIRAYTDNLCTSKLLRTVTVKLPPYNEYYYFHKDKCNSNPNFKYCKEFMDISLDEEEIDKLFDEYLKDDDTTEKNQGNNMIIILISLGSLLIVGVGITIFVLNKRKKKDDL